MTSLTRIVCMSDTHGRHERITIPPGDVLVHSGDMVRQSNFEEIRTFLAWFAAHPHPHKVLVAGNHDRSFETDPDIAVALIPPGVTYLQDDGCVIGGLTFWGSPVQPEFLNWAFNRKRGAEIARHWAMIPEGTDVVVTHGPAYGILDSLPGRGHLGCKDLRARLEVIQPRLHICGHIHGARSSVCETLGRTKMVNAAICDEDYNLVHAPVVVDL